ncbi:hypothetical protein C4568_00870 [Candidatus Parcubacteria bacterium]|nr:MAG: hypothetical protein C4568_00870 [Candidatus Parcubacteria bacterium]
MPKKGEQFQMHQERPAADHAANDNIELHVSNDNFKMHAANDNERRDVLERARTNRAFERAYQIAKHAQKGEVIFMGGVTASTENSGKLMSLNRRGDNRGEFGGHLAAMQSETVKVITHEEIARRGGNFEIATKQAIRDAKHENPDAVVVVETPLFLDEVMIKPWESNPAQLEKMMKGGHSGRVALEAWLTGIADHKESDEEEHPTFEELKGAFEHSREHLRHFIEHELHGAPFSMALTLSPATLLFIMFLKDRDMNPSSVAELMNRYGDWQDTVVHVQFKEFGKVDVQVGEHTLA